MDRREAGVHAGRRPRRQGPHPHRHVGRPVAPRTTPQTDLRSGVVAPQNRGIVLDLVIFCFNVLLVRVLLAGTGRVVHAAQEDVLAKLAVGFFFAALLVLQPVGPWLKRWSFHQRHSFDAESGAGCLLFWLMPVYLMMMIVLSATAAILISEVIVKGNAAANVAGSALFAGFAWSILSVVVVYRYFVKPKQRSRWTFLTTPRAEHLGDAAMYLNVIALQIVWGSVTASAVFREILTGTPLGRPGSFTDVLGRFIVIGILAAAVYLPARIFYLAEDKHRKLTYATMLLANVPLILSIALAPPAR